MHCPFNERARAGRGHFTEPIPGLSSSVKCPPMAWRVFKGARRLSASARLTYRPKIFGPDTWRSAKNARAKGGSDRGARGRASRRKCHPRLAKNARAPRRAAKNRPSARRAASPTRPQVPNIFWIPEKFRSEVGCPSAEARAPWPSARAPWPKTRERPSAEAHWPKTLERPASADSMCQARTRARRHFGARANGAEARVGAPGRAH